MLINKILPSQIYLCLSTETLDQSIVSVLGLASSHQISDIMLVHDLIVARQGAKKVVLLPAKGRLVLYRLPIGAQQSVLDMIILLMRLARY